MTELEQEQIVRARFELGFRRMIRLYYRGGVPRRMPGSPMSLFMMQMGERYASSPTSVFLDVLGGIGPSVSLERMEALAYEEYRAIRDEHEASQVPG